MTTHSHLLSQDELEDLKAKGLINSISFFLHQFDTELDFSNKIGYSNTFLLVMIVHFFPIC